VRLTRRDALLSAVAGVLCGCGLAGLHTVESGSSAAAEPDRSVDGSVDLAPETVATLISIAEVVYPSAVEVTPSFVETYAVRGGANETAGIQAATEDLDAAAREMTGRRFGALPPAQREGVLRELGIGSVHPRPNGTISARIRYYLVNGLLLALFTTPKGGRLFGIDNPTGHPGGYHGAAEQGVDE